MSVRWMAVQYLGGGSILRLPIVNASDMDKPFGESVLERDVKRIVINPFSESRQTFVPDAENEKLRELCIDLFDRLMDKDEHCGECRSQCEHDAWNFGDPKCVYTKRMRELGIEVDE